MFQKHLMHTHHSKNAFSAAEPFLVFRATNGFRTLRSKEKNETMYEGSFNVAMLRGFMGAHNYNLSSIRKWREEGKLVQKVLEHKQHEKGLEPTPAEKKLLSLVTGKKNELMSVIKHRQGYVAQARKALNELRKRLPKNRKTPTPLETRYMQAVLQARMQITKARRELDKINGLRDEYVYNKLVGFYALREMKKTRFSLRALKEKAGKDKGLWESVGEYGLQVEQNWYKLDGKQKLIAVVALFGIGSYVATKPEWKETWAWIKTMTFAGAVAYAAEGPLSTLFTGKKGREHVKGMLSAAALKGHPLVKLYIKDSLFKNNPVLKAQIKDNETEGAFMSRARDEMLHSVVLLTRRGYKMSYIYKLYKAAQTRSIKNGTPGKINIPGLTSEKAQSGNRQQQKIRPENLFLGLAVLFTNPRAGIFKVGGEPKYDFSKGELANKSFYDFMAETWIANGINFGGVMSHVDALGRKQRSFGESVYDTVSTGVSSISKNAKGWMKDAWKQRKKLWEIMPQEVKVKLKEYVGGGADGIGWLIKRFPSAESFKEFANAVGRFDTKNIWKSVKDVLKSSGKQISDTMWHGGTYTGTEIKAKRAVVEGPAQVRDTASVKKFVIERYGKSGTLTPGFYYAYSAITDSMIRNRKEKEMMSSSEAHYAVVRLSLSNFTQDARRNALQKARNKAVKLFATRTSESFANNNIQTVTGVQVKGTKRLYLYFRLRKQPRMSHITNTDLHAANRAPFKKLYEYFKSAGFYKTVMSKYIAAQFKANEANKRTMRRLARKYGTQQRAIDALQTIYVRYGSPRSLFRKVAALGLIDDTKQKRFENLSYHKAAQWMIAIARKTL